MLTVRLETPKGDFVTYASMPPFMILPTVLTWGTRTFTLSDKLEVDGSSLGKGSLISRRERPIYQETFAMAIVDVGTPRTTPDGARWPHDLAPGEVAELGPGGITVGRRDGGGVAIGGTSALAGTDLYDALGASSPTSQPAAASAPALPATGPAAQEVSPEKKTEGA